MKTVFLDTNIILDEFINCRKTGNMRFLHLTDRFTFFTFEKCIFEIKKLLKDETMNKEQYRIEGHHSFYTCFEDEMDFKSYPKELKNYWFGNIQSFCEDDWREIEQMNDETSKNLLVLRNWFKKYQNILNDFEKFISIFDLKIIWYVEITQGYNYYSLMDELVNESIIPNSDLEITTAMLTHQENNRSCFDYFVSNDEKLLKALNSLTNKILPEYRLNKDDWEELLIEMDKRS